MKGEVNIHKMRKQARTTRPFPAPGVFSGVSTSSMKWPIEAKIMNRTNMRRAPLIRDLRRPKFSTMYKPPKVVPKLTAPRMTWVTKLLEIPAPCRVTI